MKKILVALMLCMVSIMSFGQFVYKTVDNGFDEPYKKALSRSSEQSPSSGYLGLEKFEVGQFTQNGLLLYISGVYFCGENLYIDCVFDNGNKYNFYSVISNDNKYIFPYIGAIIGKASGEIIDCDTIMYNSFWQDVKMCSTLKVRVNQDYCEDEFYYFSLKNSSNAINYMIK